MAKKKSMNLIEAHLEKIVLLAALACLVWVLYARFIRTTGVEAGGRTVKASERARQAAEQADGILRSLKDKSSVQTQPIDPWKSTLDTFAKLQPLEASPVDAIPLSPPYGGKDGMEEEKRLYIVPDILALSEIKMDLTHSPVLIPVVSTEGVVSAGGEAAVSERSTMMAREGTQIKDMDFVTVEAKFPLADMHTLFRQNFAGPTVKKALESPDPVIAAVELQRSRLLPNGQWGEWEKASRLAVDPMAEKTLATEDFSLISRANMDVLLENRKDPVIQLMMLEPMPYSLLSGAWMPPTEKEEFEKQLKEEKRKAAAAGVGAGGAARPVIGPGGGREMAGGGEREMRGGDEARGREGGEVRSAPSLGGGYGLGDNSRYQAILSKPWAEIPKITIWAHDDQVKPGGTYRYRIRLGCFNPIVGHNWFSKEQEALKNQIVLWSPWNSPDKVVKIPERILFFPVMASRGSEQTFKMDVYREFEGTWYRERFDAIAGLTVGYPKDAEEDAASLAMETTTAAMNTPLKKKVDYSTGITILDIFPRFRYFPSAGRTVAEVNTAVVLYQDSDGIIQRVAVDKMAWPDGWAQKKTRIDRLISERKKAKSAGGAAGGAVPGGERRGGAPTPGGGEGRR